MSTSEQQMQQLVDQVHMLTAELAAQRLELDAAKNALDQQTQTATAALSVAQAAIVDPTYPDLLRKAELERDEVATVEMTEADEQLSTNLFVREQGCWHTFLLGPQGLKVNCIDFHATM